MNKHADGSHARILARSQQQAWDWSLVLASQGIEAVIDFCAAPPQWCLLVAPTEYDAAVAAIRKYEFENRAWPWRRELIQVGVVFDAGVLAWAMLMAGFFWLQSTHEPLTGLGVMDSGAVSTGQWWRLFTAVMLHGDLAHLGLNVVFGMLWIGFAMGRYGTGVGLLASYLAGVIGNLVTWLFGPARFVALGASGMVFGALGLLAAQSIAVWWETRHAPRYALGGLFAGILLFVLLGLSPDSNIFAHAGGFGAGVIGGGFLATSRPLAGSPTVNLLAGLAFCVLVLGPWLIAFAQP
ncbi:MAG: rhomboid family intramembrane serine protease [Verrucomicrobiae bacterium]|nr:rhomboid family intramembrane serine protease [Verrucomicrobiae bacterium]